MQQFRKSWARTRRDEASQAGAGAAGRRERAGAVRRAARFSSCATKGIELDEIAVLYRAHFHSMELQMELTRRGIPFQITSGMRFFEQAHIKDVAAFMRFVVNPRDEVAFKRMVRLLPGIGGRSADKLWRAWEKRAGRARRGHVVERAAPAAGRSARNRRRRGSSSRTRSMKSRRAGSPNPPAEMITSIVEAIYDDYAKANFPTTSCAAKT